MAIRIRFDTDNVPEKPTLVLGKRNGDKIGQIPNIDNIKLKDCLNNTPEFSFTVHKYDNGKLCEYWDDIKDFRLVWCKEWDMWFQMTIDVNMSDEVTKNVQLTRLAESELSQINLYNVEINTELDIERDEYTEPTILYNADNYDASLLHRIMEKAPHYSINHVDETIAKIQRTFSFDNTSIVDALNDVCTEINALVIYDSGTDNNGKIKRQISLYDLESNCCDCGYRGEFTDKCPQCGSTNIKEGYGEDTTICIDDEHGLGNDITLEVDTDSVKNCFKLVAGDDLMTATVINCNPNGTAYIWNLSDDFKSDMSDELQNKINEYNALYEEYRKTKQFNIPSDILNMYNNLVNKYKSYNQDLEEVVNPIIGYPNLMNAYYNTIDLNLYLESGLMPSLETDDITAVNQAERLTNGNLSPISMTSIDNLSITTVNSAILGIAKLFVHPSYKVSINQSSLNGTIWNGNFKVENKSDNEDFAYSDTINITIDDNYSNFVSQKLNKILNGYYEEFKTDITSLFKKDLVNFKGQIIKYSLNGLTSLFDACQSCIDIMIEQGISSDTTTTLYTSLYLPYYEKLQAISDEMKVRENEINIINGMYNEDKKGLKNYIDDIRTDMQNTLNFEKYIGTDLWNEFCSFRREDTYENSNYISDGLDNSDLFKMALEFIEVAQKEIYKSANLQHKITSSLKNLLVIKEFRPLVKYFSCGNWIRVKIDNILYKLRLLEYNIDYDNLDNIDVDFSDVTYGVDGLTDTKNILDKASSMATSYDSVKKQASQGADSNVRLDDWVRKGLDATTVNIVNRAENQTQSWDKHGMLYRQYDDITESYLDTQLKIINQGLYITDDNWKTTRTGIGRFTYLDPKDGLYKEGYGVIADTICSNLILSEEVGIYNADSSIVINKYGISVSDPNDLSTNKPSVTITPDGKLTCKGADIQGDITANSLVLTPNAIDDFGGYFVPFNKPITDPYGNKYYFEIDSNGYLQADNAYISGTIYSSKLVSCTIDVTTSMNIIHNNEIVGSIGKWGTDDDRLCNTLYFTTGYYTDDYTYTMNDYDLVLESGNDVYVTGKKHIILSTFDEVQKYETYIMVSNYDTLKLVSSHFDDNDLRCIDSSIILNNTEIAMFSTTDMSLFSDKRLYLDATVGIRLRCSITGDEDDEAEGGFVEYDKRVIRFDYDKGSAMFRPSTDYETYLGSVSYHWNQLFVGNIESGDIDAGNVDAYDIFGHAYYNYDNHGNHLSLHINSNGIQVGNANDNTLIKGQEIRLICNGASWGDYSSNIQYYYDGSYYMFRPRKTGTVKCGSAGFKWYSVYTLNGLNYESDKRSKNNINDISTREAESIIYNINPVSFRYNEDTENRKRYGIIAQDLRDVLINNNIELFSGLVITSKAEGSDEYGVYETDLSLPENNVRYSVNYEQFIAPLIKVVQNQKKEIDELRNMINTLNEQNNKSN